MNSGTGGNLRVVAICLLLVGGMGGLAYASVPLYRLFCQVTGFGGTTQRAEAPTRAPIDQTVRVRFDANVRGLPWSFAPEQREIEVRLGETVQVNYLAENTGDVATTGSATFNVTPQKTGAFFNKIACFCFTETTLEPGEKMEMPVVFFVDPEMLDYEESRGVRTITLSYTFFEVEPKPLAGRQDEAGTETSGG